MAAWNAKSGSGRPSTAAEPAAGYEVVCRCGCELTGERLPRFQVLECGECGARVFVLPRDPYPPADVHMEIPTAALVLPEKQRKPKTAAKNSTPTKSKKTVKTENATDQIPDLAMRTRTRLITPFRAILLLMVGIASATGYFLYQRSQQQQAERDFRDHSDAGLAAMKDGDFPHAATELEAAVAALERLDRDDEQARHVRQMARECRVASNLMSQSLSELLNEAVRLKDDPAGWEKHFQQTAAGKWIVLETTVEKVVDRNGQETFCINYPVFAGTQQVELDGAISVFEKRPVDAPKQPVIVALQLQSIHAPAQPNGRWFVQFNRETAFLWTDYDNLRALGFGVAEPLPDASAEKVGIPTEEQLKALLAAQSRAMGVTK